VCESEHIFRKALDPRYLSVLITGASPGGLGAETARAIARQNPKLVILAGRNLSKLKITEEIIKSDGPSIAEIRLLQIDLGSQASVRKAAEEVNGYEGPIDVLINNAAIMAVPFQLSVDGLESQLATNHVGHFLFTNLIISKLLAAEGGCRVVNVSSSGHKREKFRFEDYNFEVKSPP
jgi:NAD(P)-dependent dehydrogenase (short-subunit alcohol dehydrogenase family)